MTATSTPDPFDEGYPPSSARDLDPGPDLSQSLDEADRQAGDEHRVVGRDWREDDDGRFGDGDDAEVAEVRHL